MMSWPSNNCLISRLWIAIVCNTIDIASLPCCDMPLNKSWHDYNESLIERGRVLIDVSFLKSSNKEIKKMNIGKV
jgi:hypothetical protein